MASSFMGLYVQRDALCTAQKSLDIVGNNISNVETEGYSRQRVDVSSVGNSKGSIMYNTSIALAGQGVKPDGVAQIRDALLDKKVRTYSSDYMNIGVKVKVLSDVEDALDNIESEDSGFNAILSKFKSTLQNLSADNANRNEMASIAQNAAKSVVEYLNMYSSRLDVISEQTIGDADKAVTRINSILSEMGSLNKQISDSYINMNYISMTNDGYQVDSKYGPLELKDKANSLMDELSQYVNIEFKEEANGSFTVKMAGQTVVKDKDYAQMAMRDAANPTDETAVPDPMNMEFVVSNTIMDSDHWKAAGNTPESRKAYVLNNTPIDITPSTMIEGGSLRGYLDTYNGNGNFTNGTNEYRGVPYYKSMINAFTRTFADEFNSIYNSSGFALFDYDATDFDSTAESLRLTQDWLDNPILISKPYEFTSGSDSMIELDNTYVQRMLGVFSGEHTYSDGLGYTVPLTYTFEKFSANINDELGSQVEYETNVSETTEIMYNSVSTAREEVMGVSMDEEGINMLNYQKWYSAVARMTNTLDEALDKLINGTGRVGL